MARLVAARKAIYISRGDAPGRLGRPEILAIGLLAVERHYRRQCRKLGLDYNAIVAQPAAPDKSAMVCAPLQLGPDIDD